MRFLVTGASGFVGRQLCAELTTRGHNVRAAMRKRTGFDLGGCEVAEIADIGADAAWEDALRGIEVIIHLAARVHVMREDAADPMAEFRRVNVAGTERLARQAAQAGVRRMLCVSSVKVSGEKGLNLTEETPPSPQDPYGISKWEAERALQRVAKETGLEVVIARPPLVYGPGVKGNFAQMMRVLQKGIPLPLASVRNLRSFVCLDNLADGLILCATHPAAAGRTYLVSDGEDVSTPQLLRKLGEAMGHPARLFPCPVPFLKLAGRLTGRSEQVERLTGSLCVDSGKIRRELGWRPPCSLHEGLRVTAKAWL